MSIRYLPGPKNVIADSLSRGALQDWQDFQQEVVLDDPDIGIGISALFEASTSPEEDEEALQTPTTRTATTATEPRETVEVAIQTSSRTTSSGEPGATSSEEPQNPTGGNDAPLRQDHLDYDDLKQLQRADPLWQSIIRALEGRKVAGDQTLLKKLPQYHLNTQGILCYQPRETDSPRVVIPQAMVPQLVSECHSHPLAGHYHAQAVLDRLKPKFYWPSMNSDVTKYCDSCVKCHSKKTNRRSQPAKLGSTPVTYGPWETVHTDLVGPLPETEEGYRWILLIVCAFTKFVELIPLKDATAETVAQALVATFYRYGIPFHLISDNGVQYRATLLAEINKILGVRHIFISAYHSQANSNVERMCGVVKTMIAVALDRTQREWNIFLGASQYAINSTVQRTNQWSPAFLMFGRRFRLPIEQALGAEPSPNSAELDDMVTQLRERQFDAITEVIANQKASRSYQKEWYDKRAKEKSFEVGDQVYLFRPVTAPGNSSKLTPKWSPGHVVVGRHSNGLTYDVRKPGSGKPPEKVHCNRLKPQPMSHVYREGLKSARVFKRHQNVGDSPRAPVRDSTGQGSPKRGPPRESDTESSELAVPRRLFRAPPEEVGSDLDSGVTTVLEALGEESFYYSSPDEGERPVASIQDEEEGQRETSEESDGDYATIPRQPVATPQRPRRNRRPPVRFTPS